MKVMVETSAHHVHVTKETLEALFGKGATLTNKKNLSQPGQFACVEKVTVVGPKSEMKMSILGPERSADQVEISLTDARKLGIAAPVRESGDIAGTPGCKLVGPEGEVEIDFTDTEKPDETPPPVPEGKTEIEDPGEEHEVNPDPAVPEVTAPPAEESTSSNEPAPGSSNGSGAVYDPVFGWVVPGDVQQSTGDSDGDLNKQVGNMGG